MSTELLVTVVAMWHTMPIPGTGNLRSVMTGMRRNSAKKTEHLYELLLEAYGPQGWWPLSSLAGRRGFDERGYHPGIDTYPRTEAQRFEIILGAILTQNTAWTNVEKALRVLRRHHCLRPDALERCGEERLATLIKSSGYFRQKARKIVAMLEFLASGEELTREALLRVWGIGPETADSILLYAYRQPCFVVDAYTRRVLEHLRLVKPGASYGEIQALFHQALTPDVAMFNEYHALLVEHGKRYYSKRPHGAGDPVVAALRKAGATR